jgi:hypothetical protein
MTLHKEAEVVTPRFNITSYDWYPDLRNLKNRRDVALAKSPSYEGER